MNKPTIKPVAVLISDIHYNLHTLDLADAAMRQAVAKAMRLQVPLIVAGDLHDTKANLRGECVNTMIKTFEKAHYAAVPTYIMVGNHDLINEKSDQNSLNFISPYAVVVDKPLPVANVGLLIPYMSDIEKLKELLREVPPGSRLIMHQGCHESDMGDYVQDKTALPKECFKDFRVISGHYHTRQDIECGRPRQGAVGLFSYIGNPYTLSFGEAKDPEKGFRVLMSDGTLEFVPTKLRRHRVLDYTIDQLRRGEYTIGVDDTHDLVWVKIRGTREELLSMTRQRVAEIFAFEQGFKLDLIPTECQVFWPKNLTPNELMDSLIDSLSNTSDERKQRLKQHWKSLCE